MVYGDAVQAQSSQVNVLHSTGLAAIGRDSLPLAGKTSGRSGYHEIDFLFEGIDYSRSCLGQAPRKCMDYLRNSMDLVVK